MDMAQGKFCLGKSDKRQVKRERGAFFTCTCYTCTGRSTNSPVLCLFLCPVPVCRNVPSKVFGESFSLYLWGVFDLFYILYQENK